MLYVTLSTVCEQSDEKPNLPILCFCLSADVCPPNAGGNPPEPVDTIVPTAVGCVLAGLILILIITYIVGRCRRPGYQRM